MRVIYEDNHLIAIHKPAGLLSQGDETGDKSAIHFVKKYIAEKYNKPGAVFLGLVHRLDRPVSGVLLFARTSKALTRMNELFKKRAVQKTYYAISSERPDPFQGRLEHILLKDKSKNTVKVVKKESTEAKKALLHYVLSASFKNYNLIKVNPETGRPHQIRVQLSKSGFPILNDTKYGGQKVETAGQKIFLHCHKLEFIHPVQKEKCVISCLPEFDAYWKKFDGKF